MAGLYGPDRVPSLNALREASPIVGDPNVLLNLIHIDDAAELMLAVADSPDASDIELGCDGNPVRRIEYYQHMTRRLGLPDPVVLDDRTAATSLGLNLNRLRQLTSKACDPAPTIERTGWSPKYPTYQHGLDAIFGV